VDLEAISVAAKEVGAITVVDATQAIGWLPIEAGQFDAVVCAAYKWLCTPRGVAYMTISERMQSKLTPTSAGWFAGEVVHDSYYGLPLRLAKDARRFDISPAWFSWVGAASANFDLLQVGIEKIYDHNVALTDKLAQALDLDSHGSAILSIKVNESLDTANLPFRASSRGGGLRVSFHLYNDLDDVDLVFETLKGKVIID
jgi:selenocysteine lyase/cysteine desulfurase